jgi:hypothetical protein
MRWEQHVARTGEEEKCIWAFVGNQKEIDHLGHRHTCVVNIQMDLNEIRLEVLVWINLTLYWKKWRAFVKWVMNFWVL